jgi:hypothetical protein
MASTQICMSEQLPTTKVYTRRYLVLGAFLCLTITNAYQWIQFAPIGDKLLVYYNVPQTSVDVLAVIYEIVNSFVLRIFPCTTELHFVSFPFV